MTAPSFEYAKYLPQSPSIGGTTSYEADHVHLSFGYPHSSLFPLRELEQAASRAILEQGHLALHYSGGPGTGRIKQWIIDRMRVRSVAVPAENALVTAGAGQAIDVAARVLINPEDEVWVESPTYFSALRSFQLAGARVRSFPLDERGLQTEAVEAALLDYAGEGRAMPKLLYVMPNFHNPGVVTMSVERRKKLAGLASRYNFYIIEDDAYGDLSFNNVYLPAIYSWNAERVIYIGTFSKIIGPGLRLGWIIGNTLLLEKVRLFLLGSQINPFTQEIAAHFLDRIPFEPYLQKIISLYKTLSEVMVEALRANFGDDISFTVPAGGFFILITFKRPIDLKTYLPAAAARGVSVVGGTEFYTADAPEAGHRQIRLCFTYSGAEQIREGVKRLAEVYYAGIK